MIVKAGGQDRELRFSYKALKESNLYLRANPKLDETDLEIIEHQVFLAFKHGCLFNGKDLDFKKSDIENWLEEDVSILMKVMNYIAECVLKITDTEEKKK